jgi:ubiquinone/menaquinone biosynthesis C-methylase UbiE
MIKDSIFTHNYIRLRKQEGRLYTDAEVLQLPSIDPTHIHYKEWQTRKKSAKRLLNYLKRKKVALSILEIGCGNGWLSGMLSSISQCTVTASEINTTELQQAWRVFYDKKNIEFVQEDIRAVFFDDKKFDIIIFAASVQYFASFQAIINRAILLLNEGGEIHITDSFFYKEAELEQAISRTEKYYRSCGFVAMSDFYFHHTTESLKNFNYTFLFNPGSISNKLFNKTSVFPWVCIQNK